ncbi:MAG: hypothetical protein KF910_06120 [Brevundimonas sp.]|uniref:hypothetical protein n=1 Tax=Brevundimonas sp. TaxID=1871086 RepID=UPI0025C05BED|nr:hypothetical protein [Brevundimonas sp.]MBX3477161.1 hypothetical protein [Brevundimonas sp.]
MMIATAIFGVLLQATPFGACDAMFTKGDAVESVPAPWVAEALSAGEVPPQPDDVGIGAIVCERENLVPQSGDEQILSRLGLPLYIAAGERVGVLEALDGQLTFRVLEGELAEDEVPAMMAFLNTAQDAARRPAPVEQE